MAVSGDRSERDLRRGWIIVAMVMVFMMINFADKAVLGLAAGPIMKDLHLTNEQFGEIGSAFFLLFSISAVLVGFVVNRLSTRIVLAVMASIWTLTLMPMVGLVPLWALVASRIVLGAGEGPAYPVAIHAVYKWFPDDRRAFPTSFVSIGGAIGVGSAPLLTWIILTYGWHVAFGFLGVVGFLWVVLWLMVGKEGPLNAHQAEAGAAGLEHVPYAALLTSRTFLGVEIACFAAYWALALGVVWLPSFLIKAGGYSPTTTGWILVLPPMLQVVLSPSLGFLSQRLNARGVSSRLSRGLIAAGCVTISGVAMILLSRSTGEVEQVPLVMLAFAVCSVTYALGPPLIGEISPVRQRGAMLGISNALFSTAGLVAPWLMGHIVDVGASPAQGFRDGFLFAGLLIVGGGLVAAILIHPQADLARFRRRDAAVGGKALSALRP
jgi:MFS family permease